MLRLPLTPPSRPASLPRWGRHGVTRLALAAALIMNGTAQAAPAPEPAPAAAAAAPLTSSKPPVVNSTMDAPLFYQLLVAEIQARQGQPGAAYQLYLEAARRNQDAALFQRAVDLALASRAGEQALAAAKAWRQTLPQSREASEYTAQILLALGRSAELASPLRSLIQLSPAAQQGQVLASLPRSLQRLTDRKAAAEVVDEATQPWRSPPLERAEAWAASADGWTQARQPAKALPALRRALELEPASVLAGLHAVELMEQTPEAEALLRTQLDRPDAPPLVRLAYARKLATTQRLEEAERELIQLIAAQPDANGTRVLLAAIQLERKQLDAAEATLKPVLAGLPRASGAEATTLPPDLEQASLLQAQIAEQRGQTRTALQWLDRADPARARLPIQAQRARLMARDGQLGAARALIRGLPEAEPRDGLAKVQAEAQLLRDARQWREAHRVLSEGTQRFPDVAELLYDQAMMADKIKEYDEMERVLRRLIELEPDNANAHNALGYSLAERGQRLAEARTHLERAIALKPGDPFITDSLGWLAFREGRVEEALRLLREAWGARPDAEIGAHLGEVLWGQQQRDEATRIWRESWQRDRDNEVLQETLRRFKVRF